MMTRQQILDFASSSASMAIDGAADYRSVDDSIAAHRENIRDTLNDERCAEFEQEAFAVFDALVSDALEVTRSALRSGCVEEVTNIDKYKVTWQARDGRAHSCTFGTWLAAANFRSALIIDAIVDSPCAVSIEDTEHGMTDAEIECLEECIQSHVHGFYTCAEVGVQPDLNAFIANVFESVEEYEQHPTFFAVRRYIMAHWEALRAAMLDGGAA